MDKKTLHRILVHPTRTGLDKVEKEVARLNGVNDVLRQELVTWKSAVTTRNETIVGLNNTTIKLHNHISTLEEDKESVNRRIKENQRKDAFQVERLRISVQAAHVAVREISSHLAGIADAVGQTELAMQQTRDSIAGDIEINWTKELSYGSDDIDSE